jgi:diapolycopene oxygenase
MKAAIIGSGLAGLASAVRLALQGIEVHVFEANAYPGGKLHEFTLQGYRFDAGPSVSTMPWLVDELFELAGKTLANILTTAEKSWFAAIFILMAHTSPAIQTG